MNKKYQIAESENQLEKCENNSTGENIYKSKQVNNDLKTFTFVMVILFIAIFGAILKWQLLSGKSFWGDEIIVARIAKIQNFTEMLNAARTEVNGPAPLDHILNWKTYQLYKSEKIFYALPLIFNTLSILLIGLTAAKIHSKKAGIIAVVLLLFNPLQTDMALYARFYSHYQFWINFGLLFYFSILSGGKFNPLLWFFYFLTRVFAIYTTQLAVITFTAECSAVVCILLFNLVQSKKSDADKISVKINLKNTIACLSSNILALLIFLPWALSAPIKKTYGYNCQFNIPETIINILRDALCNWMGKSFISASPVFVLVLIVLIFILTRKRFLPLIFNLAAIYFVLLIMITTAALHVFDFFYAPRLIFPLVFPLVLIEAGAAAVFAGIMFNNQNEVPSINQKENRIISILNKTPFILRVSFISILFLVFSAPSLYRIIKDEKACWKNMAEFIKENAADPESNIILASDINYAGFAMYYIRLDNTLKQELWVDYYKWLEIFQKNKSPKTIWFFSRFPVDSELPFKTTVYNFPGYWEGGALHKIEEKVTDPSKFNFFLYNFVKNEIEHSPIKLSLNVYYTYSMILFFGGNYEQSLKQINIALAGDAENSNWLLVRALNNIAKENPKPALEDLIKANKIDRENGAVIKYLFRLLYKTKSLIEFSPAADKVIRDLKTIPALTEAGKTLFELKYYDYSAKCFKKLYETNPENPWHPFFYAKALFEQKKYDEAQKLFQRACDMTIDTPENKVYPDSKLNGFFKEEYDKYKEKLEIMKSIEKH